MSNNRFNRIFLIVLDSVGIGEAPDAANYNDVGAHTLGHIAEAVNGLTMPAMAQLGLGNITKIQGIEKVSSPKGHFGTMEENSVGKDTLTGHWEIAGIITDIPIQTFPDGFSEELITNIEKSTGKKVIGNKTASGTKIIEELGEEHIETGSLIVYTSADSVLQIAAHEEVYPPVELYKICEIVRELTIEEPYTVGRVIARPFIGENGVFTRTKNRRDFTLKPYEPTILNSLKDDDFDVIAIGKINDIFSGEGITESLRTKGNMNGVDKLLDVIDKRFCGLCFLNLVDFDENFGHRRDPKGYAKALESYDNRLPEVLAKMNEDDLLIITADHGNDPTHHGTDHTRELVPLIVYHTAIEQGRDLGQRKSFADIASTIAANFNVRAPQSGESFLEDMIEMKCTN